MIINKKIILFLMAISGIILSVQFSLANLDLVTSSSSIPASSQFPIETIQLVKTIHGKVNYLDGKPITNAIVRAYNNNFISSSFDKIRNLMIPNHSFKMIEGITDSNGNYSFKVDGGGKWHVGVYPKITSGISSNWFYNKPYTEINFKEDSTVEEAQVNFIVEGNTSVVKGFILKPDGKIPDVGTINISFRDSLGYEHRVHNASDGSFLIYLPVGTYTPLVFSTDSSFEAPVLGDFSLNSGEQKDLGKIYLILRQEKIIGKVTDSKNFGIANILVRAFNNLDNKSVDGRTDLNGLYSLNISAGEWEVDVFSDPVSGFSYEGNPRRVTVINGKINEVNFILEKGKSRIDGSIVNENGQIITDVYGYVSLFKEDLNDSTFLKEPIIITKEDEFTSLSGGPIKNGVFGFSVYPGTYILRVYFPPDSKYGIPNQEKVVIVAGETKKINLLVSKTIGLIKGSIKDQNGNIITNLISEKIKIYFSSGSFWQNASIDFNTGTYQASLSTGTWYLGYSVDSSSGYSSITKDIELSINGGETKEFDIILKSISSSITGVVKTVDGKFLANVWITADDRSFYPDIQEKKKLEKFALEENKSEATTLSQASKSFGVNSDTSGNFKISLPEGTYYLRAYYPDSFGYINPKEVKVEVKSGETKNIELIFRKPEFKINGFTIVDGKNTSAFIFGWEEQGGYTESQSSSDGSYSLKVSKGKWRISAGLKIDNTYYKTAESLVEIKDSDFSLDLVLLPISKLPLANRKIIEAKEFQTVELTDGTKVILPANSLSTTGLVNINLEPKIDTPSFGSNSIIGLSYEIGVSDSSDQSIINLNSEIIISLTYSEEELKNRGLIPENLILSYLDETNNVWKPLDKQVIDKKNKIVSGVTNHLTRFAIVAPADILPPPAPTLVKAIKNNGEIIISWINPEIDFHHIKIYRSLKSGELGEVIFNYLVGTSQVDIPPSLSVYYVVRAVDLSGNESLNITQTAISQAGKIKFLFKKNLILGSFGQEVKNIQSVLIQAGFNVGKIDGRFGKLTLKAVKNFQEKYGLKVDGIVGKKTIKKLNELE